MRRVPVLNDQQYAAGGLHGIDPFALGLGGLQIWNVVLLALDQANRGVAHVVLRHRVGFQPGVGFEQGINAHLIRAGLDAYVHGVLIAELKLKGVFVQQFIQLAEHLHVVALGVSIVVGVGDGEF